MPRSVDPFEKPDGYEAPTSARELLDRYEDGERFFEKAYLRGVDLGGAILRDANLRGSYLSGACLEDSDLSRAIFEGSYLKDASFTHATVLDVDFEGANLKRVSFGGARVLRSHFVRAEISDTAWTGAQVGGSVFAQTDIGAMNLHPPVVVGPCLVDWRALALTGLEQPWLPGLYASLTGLDLAAAAEIVEVLRRHSASTQLASATT